MVSGGWIRSYFWVPNNPLPFRGLDLAAWALSSQCLTFHMIVSYMGGLVSFLVAGAKCLKKAARGGKAHSRGNSRFLSEVSVAGVWGSWSGCVCSQKASREMNIGAQLRVSFSFNPHRLPQSMWLYHSHPGWVLATQLNVVTPSQAYPEVCLLSDSWSCQVSKQ